MDEQSNCCYSLGAGTISGDRELLYQLARTRTQSARTHTHIGDLIRRDSNGGILHTFAYLRVPCRAPVVVGPAEVVNNIMCSLHVMCGVQHGLTHKGSPDYYYYYYLGRFAKHRGPLKVCGCSSCVVAS